MKKREILANIIAQPNWFIARGISPLIATAIHDGHLLHDDVAALMALTDDERLREEDPFTSAFIQDVGNRVVVHRSRFEVDLNRPREGAVYLRPEQAWGLQIWRETPSAEMIEALLRQHHGYYKTLHAVLDDMQRTHGRFVLLDIHSYNHRRNGPDAPPTAQADAPDINIGTFSMDRAYWAPVLDAFIECLKRQPFPGRQLDVRENIAFSGKGEQTRFVHAHFPRTGCAIAVEFKKIFMDEWTGKPDPECIEAIRSAICASLPVLEAALMTISDGNDP